MRTELLTRRMDLIHTQSGYYVDRLQMDTSYPVKLSGIIVKVFLATNDYSDLDQNGNKVSDDSIKFVITSKSSPLIPSKYALNFSILLEILALFFFLIIISTSYIFVEELV